MSINASCITSVNDLELIVIFMFHYFEIYFLCNCAAALSEHLFNGWIDKIEHSGSLKLLTAFVKSYV